MPPLIVLGLLTQLPALSLPVAPPPRPTTDEILVAGALAGAALVLPGLYVRLGGLRLLFVRRPTCPVCGFCEARPERERRITRRLERLLKRVLLYVGLPAGPLLVFGLAAKPVRPDPTALGLLLAGEATVAILLLFLVPSAERREPGASLRDLALPIVPEDPDA